MVAGWAVVVTALLYLSLLFAVAHWGDRSGASLVAGRARPWIYALALAVYCTSWTFYGSVGLATGSGLDFLMIYVGPILVFVFGHRVLARIVRIAKDQNITSVADFVAARYGKSERVAALVCLIAVVGSLPYIALQLKAVSSSLDVFLAADETMAYARTTFPMFGDLAFVVAAVLAFFAVGFGTRHADATEHQDGLVLAISLESVVKLVAFLMVGFWTIAVVFGGLPGLVERLASPQPGQISMGDFLGQTSSPGYLATLALLSAIAIVMLPRQFHMGVVENREPDDLRRAAWLFPLYLVLINVFVVPIAIAGADALVPGSVDSDMTVLGLPLAQGAGAMALVAFIGGLSAATAMVIVESVALAIMISNHLVIPLVLRRRGAFASAAQPGERGSVPDDLGGFVLVVRRIAIVAMIMLAYLYYRAAGDAALAAIGLLAFAALAQIAPAFIGGLVWRRGTAAGAAAGLSIGFLVWAYTLMLPSIAWHSPIVDGLLAAGPFGIDALRPTSLFGTSLPELTHGVVWSLGLNVAAYVLVSLARPMTALERLQAAAYMPVADAPATPSFRFFRAVVTVDELRSSVARYLGEERANRSFEGFASARGARLEAGAEADIHLLRYAEHLLASAIGASSARLALSLVLKRRNVSTADALKLLDDASAAIQANRDLLQHALDHARQGITVLDSQLHILCWNRAFVDLYDLPPEFVRVGISLDEIVRFNASRGSYGPGVIEQQIAQRIHSFVHDTAPVRLRLYPHERVIEIRTTPLPDGGFVTTYTDVTEAVAAEEARARNAEELERRVAERTEELTRLNEALIRAKAEAEDANASKTRFLAAASHDILQPLNAARLYATALVERDREGGDATLAENVDASLDAVEEILTALLDISRLDTGAMKPQWSSFRLDEMLRQLQREFEPVAAEKGLRLRFVAPSLTVRSDRRLLRRLLQNLISNAIKYTPSGTVLVGARRRGGRLRLDVLDTGLGIPPSKQRIVFREFQRLDQGAKVARGLGLGLSIVERIARVLDHTLDLSSESGRGSRFSVLLPVVAPLPAMAQPAEAPIVPAMPLAGLRVLAIDNEPAILEGMRTLLGGWGCRVGTAASLKEAMERLRDEPAGPDVVIADYHLDEGTGIEAIAALRWKLGDLPAILLTADRTLPVRDEAAEKHIHVLNKPLKPAALRALLARWRAERRAAAE
ncbi:PAS domain-containing hybrid sensor histidine kinase/response regulator [Salinarimonas rosea]|uniref:PAS domain-containing hybrid sensor histidine kinase/response regulator n=1 Tax=Salinarimonas rosea TaxID=552063 RepID=UPI00040C9AB8|nr:NahK/ErcS family hybrid sensor histidine kinase/response regulator [Salinarimonas rosea]